ncbi:uncharacterized protein CIMG_04534 [Coccidioides immitis RS]|uniref:Uncharacterized protein n=1 Tax=Coccidioides immitis (strain RS) TaxID=246410 RepID=J3KDP7_COCIM|nr:uncharacterized protein CIMG_04534 [Coccidioides immitis RS]EAS33510.3 hypothetical protein CIMG_04534 [Coccidioides immitis RS]
MTEPTTSRLPSVLLEPPPKGVELEDPGAQESAVESDDEHFSDASEGRNNTGLPRLDIPQPQEVKSLCVNVPLSPGGTPIPLTVVEKVDPDDDTRYSDEPGTPAYKARKMDAVLDLVYKMGEWDPELSAKASQTLSQSPSTSPLPETKLSRVDSPPERISSPSSFSAHKRRPSDALADVVEDVQDIDGSTALPGGRASSQELDQNSSPIAGGFGNGLAHDEENAPLGEDFDDFKEGDDDAEHDDFGDFDNEFQEAPSDAAIDIEHTEGGFTPMETSPTSAPALLDLNSIDSLSNLLEVTSDHLDDLFPKSASLFTLPPVDPIPDSSAIFSTERSLSLWSQLVAPPPLQPPNWTKSRIRRLFLVSLGVPVDLDEILPASKQKKLVLPSITIDETTRNSHDASRRLRSNPKKSHEGSDRTARSSTSTDTRRSGSRNRPSRRRRGQPSAPELDLSAVRRLCATTDAALDGFTDEEMQQHIKILEEMTVRASGVLEYWLKKRDGQVGEKEAYNGVIENLVKHARQVRS